MPHIILSTTAYDNTQIILWKNCSGFVVESWTKGKLNDKLETNSVMEAMERYDHLICTKTQELYPEDIDDDDCYSAMRWLRDTGGQE